MTTTSPASNGRAAVGIQVQLACRQVGVNLVMIIARCRRDVISTACDSDQPNLVEVAGTNIVCDGKELVSIAKPQ